MIDFFKKHQILIAASILSFFGSYVGSSVRVSIPTIAKDLNIPIEFTPLIPLFFLIPTVLLSIPVGYLSDNKLNKVVFFRTGLIIFIVSIILCAISNSMNFFLFANFLLGIGGIITSNMITSLLILEYDASIRGKVLGINIASVYLGISLGPPLGGFITDFLSWHFIFLIYLPFGLLVLITSFFSISSKDKKYLNVNENFLVVVKNVIKNKTFVLSIIASFFNYVACFSTTLILSLYFQIIISFNAFITGLILFIQPLVQSLSAIIGGRLSDKYNPFFIASFGAFNVILSFVFLLFYSNNLNYFLVFIPLILQGLGLAFFSSSNANIMVSSVEKKYFGFVSSSMAFARTLGQLVSILITFIIFSIFLDSFNMLDRVHIDKGNLIYTFRICFIIFLLAGIVSLICSLKRINLK